VEWHDRAQPGHVLQETWLAVIEGIDRFEQRSSLRTWITRILMNKARTHGVHHERSVPFSSLATARDDDLGPTVPPDRFLPADHARRPGHWAAPPPSWDELPPERVEAGWPRPSSSRSTPRGGPA